MKEKDEADYQQSQLVASFSELAVPIEPSKLEGPSQYLSFLGIEVDTVIMQLCLPQEKVMKLHEKLQSSIHSKSLTNRALQSLVEMLQFTTKVVCGQAGHFSVVCMLCSKLENCHHIIYT